MYIITLTRLDPSGQAYWVFDGRGMTLISDDGRHKRPIITIPAVSGRPGTTPADAGKPSTGPLPPGEYSVDPGGIGYWGPIPWPGTDFTGGHGSWGDARAPLTPKPGTNTHGRGGFMLHGGDDVGSAGCIDVGGNDLLIMDLIKNWSGGRPMTVVVSYGPGVKVPGTPSKPKPWDDPRTIVYPGVGPWRK